MNRELKAATAWLLLALIFFTGCAPTQPFFLHEDGDLSHYLDQMQDIAYPDVETAEMPEAVMSIEPLTVLDPDFDKWWDLNLEEVMAITLHNSKVIRNTGQVSQFGIADGLLNRTASSPTVYDPAITASTTSNRPNLGTQVPGSIGAAARGNRQIDPEQFNTAQTVGGVEDALAVFDAQFAAVYGYDHQDTYNNIGTANVFTSSVNQRAVFDAVVSKRFATGGAALVRHRVDYTRNNSNRDPAAPNFLTGRALPSDYTASVDVRVDHPLIRGRGAFINRIPIILARINEDISIADFEISIRNLLLDVENTYWDLLCAYRNFETAKAGRDAAQRTWRNAYELFKGNKGALQSEAQSREQYLFFRVQLESSLGTLLETEARLRYLMGIAPTDGRLIRPVDEPVIAEVRFEWNQIRTEALYRYAELRQQKWRIKQRELELANARNLLLPALNLFAQHSWTGAGDEYVTADRKGLDFPTPGSTAWDNLTQGEHQSSFVGLEFVPAAFGARRELARIRNAQLGLRREESRLEDQELQTVHLLSTAVRNKALNFRQIQTNLNRWAAADQEIDSATTALEAGRASLNNRSTIDILLDAQRRRALAQSDYYRAVCEYNKAIADVHFRKGSLMEYNDIRLAEGPWPEKAYFDALEKARQRDASYYFNYGYTRPGVVSRGPVATEIIDTPPHHGVLAPGETDPNLEVIPTPQAEPLQTPGGAPMDSAPPQRSDTADGTTSVLRTSTSSPHQWGDLGLGGGKAEGNPNDAGAAESPVSAVAPSPADVNPLR